MGCKIFDKDACLSAHASPFGGLGRVGVVFVLFILVAFRYMAHWAHFAVATGHQGPGIPGYEIHIYSILFNFGYKYRVLCMSIYLNSGHWC